jgi:hypothetical protein
MANTQTINAARVLLKVARDLLASSGTDPIFPPQEIAHLPEKAQQFASSEDELYGQAEVGLEEMLDFLDRGRGVDRTIGARHYMDMQTLTDEDIDKPGPIIVTAPLKSRDRAREKVEMDYDGDWSKITDVVRATIAVDTIDEVPALMDTLKSLGLNLAQKPKDRFANPTEYGYCDLMMNLILPCGHIGELQVHVKPILKAREKAHYLYEQLRDIEGKAKSEGREEMTPEESEKISSLYRQMVSFYRKAWSLSGMGMARAASVPDEIQHFSYNGNPAILARGRFPVVLVGGTRKVIYSYLRFMQNADRVNENGMSLQ